MTAFEISKKIIDVLETSNWVENNVKERRKWIIEQVGEILELKPDGGMAHAYKTV